MIFKFTILLLAFIFTQQQNQIPANNGTNTAANANANANANDAVNAAINAAINATTQNSTVRGLAENMDRYEPYIQYDQMNPQYNIKPIDVCRKQCFLKKRIQQIDFIWTQYNPIKPFWYRDASPSDKKLLIKYFTQLINSPEEHKKVYESPLYNQEYVQEEYPKYDNQYGYQAEYNVRP